MAPLIMIYLASAKIWQLTKHPNVDMEPHSF